MNKVNVLIKVDKNNDMEAKVFYDIYDAEDYAMQELFGEDWTSQIEDDEWEM
jgi:hypothetical protein